MSANSCMILGGNLKWETNVNDFPSFSPVFSYMRSKWKLKFSVYYDKEIHEFFCVLSLINCGDISFVRAFELSLIIENKSQDIKILCPKLSITSICEVLWLRNIDKQFRDLTRFSKDISVTCVFPETAGLHLELEADKKDQIVQASEKCLSCLKDTEHPSCTVSELPSQSLATQNMESLSKDIYSLLGVSHMSDLEIRCGKTSVFAHKNILAARSTVFHSMFQNDVGSIVNGVLIMDNVEPDVLYEFLRYLYSGKILDLTEELAFKLYSVSIQYAVFNLRKVCSNFMAANLKEGNFLKYLKLAETHNDADLKASVADFLIERGILLTKGDWLSFSNEFPVLANQIYEKYVTKSLLKNA